MKTKISANTNKNTTIHNIKSHLKKLFGIEKKKLWVTLKNIHHENRDYNFQVYTKHESTINWRDNKQVLRSKYNFFTKPSSMIFL